jgi:hypothetical protein
MQAGTSQPRTGGGAEWDTRGCSRRLTHNRNARYLPRPTDRSGHCRQCLRAFGQRGRVLPVVAARVSDLGQTQVGARTPSIDAATECVCSGTTIASPRLHFFGDGPILAGLPRPRRARSRLCRHTHRLDLVLNRALTGKGSPRASVPVPRIRCVALEQVDDSVHPRRER